MTAVELRDIKIIPSMQL